MPYVKLIKKDLNLYLYRMPVSELSVGDPEQRLQFCKRFLKQAV
jgi:hypothetical protein